MIHLVGFPHTRFDGNHYSSCAFTAKAVRTVGMWRKSGHDVTVYWPGGDVDLLTEAEQEAWFGKWDAAQLPVVQWNPNLDYWATFHARAITAIRDRIRPGDIVAVVGGAVSQQVVDAFHPDYTTIEPGVGYEGICRNTFACFESYAWMHNRYGQYGIGDGRFYDAVIPNACDPDEWTTGPDEGYALFVGRLISRKGPHVAAQIAARAGLKLKMAGAGVAHTEPGRITCTDGTIIEGDHVEYVGPVGGDERRRLFAEASVLLMPTLYIEPFGNVHIEAMMSGVGVVVPDFGVFTETVPADFRFRSMAEADRALKRAVATRGAGWRHHAIKTAGIERCRELYDTWFDRLHGLRDGRGGFYAA